MARRTAKGSRSLRPRPRCFWGLHIAHPLYVRDGWLCDMLPPIPRPATLVLGIADVPPISPRLSHSGNIAGPRVSLAHLLHVVQRDAVPVLASLGHVPA